MAVFIALVKRHVVSCWPKAFDHALVVDVGFILLFSSLSLDEMGMGDVGMCVCMDGLKDRKSVV